MSIDFDGSYNDLIQTIDSSRQLSP
jgi:hypothetical protein